MFPLFFLAFMIPLPEAAVDFLENASKEASAEVANWLFLISGTPVLRTGTVFQLPGITIEVAKECSGIRSSLVLVITSLLAANMFLRTTWRRALLVGAVIPLGLLRNGLRILVISLLCVHIGPQMIQQRYSSPRRPGLFRRFTHAIVCRALVVAPGGRGSATTARAGEFEIDSC